MVSMIFTMLLLQNFVLTNYFGMGIIVKEMIERPYFYNLLFLIFTIVISIPLYFINFSFIPEYIKYLTYIILILLIIFIFEQLIKLIFKKLYINIKDTYYYLYINSAIYGIIIINLINKLSFSKYITNVTLSSISFILIYLVMNLNKAKLESKYSLSIKLITLGLISLIFSRFLI